MSESLNPPPWHRLTAALRPDWTRTIAARRIAAGGLVVLAAIAAVRSDPQGEHTEIVVAARDLSPGVSLTAEDLELETQSSESVPDGAQRELQPLIGATLAGPARRGEALTDVRVLGPRLAAATRGPDSRIVPLHLADTALVDLVRPGDMVDVLTAGEGTDSEPRVVATGAVVILVSEEQNAPGRAGDRVVLVALPARTAHAVAGAALTQPVTLAFR